MAALTNPPTPDSAGRFIRWLSRRRTASATQLSPADIEGFRRAQALAFDCAQATAAEMRPGWTEGQTQAWMTTWLRGHGVKTWLHKPIVAFAARTLAPDAEWAPAKGEGLTLGDADVAILDCSPIVDGFTGDIAYTVSVGENPELRKAQDFLSDLRAQLPGHFADPQQAAGVFDWVTEQMSAAGYQNAVNGYVGHVLGHRVYRHGRLASAFPYFLPERPFGYMLSWHAPGFLLKIVSRLVLPEELGPFHTGPKTGIWAMEPHLRIGTFGAKFEELLVVEDGNAYWLDDKSQQRIEIPNTPTA
ncbi:M24 family metallopeptidase [Nocardia sp. NPDC101769]|uniref:M24 family metallopeptidase n=1 Tax=Nocardia sp. NPDC101769 TaxID=3364333 RepID=UPI003800344C